MLGMASWSTRASAYRPFDSTDADVAKPGELEFEIGPVGYLAAEGERFVVAPAIIGNAGLVERVELVLEGKNRIRASPAPGVPRDEIGDAALSLKTILREGSMQGGSGPSVATEIGTLLPAAEPETRFGASGALIVSHRAEVGAAHLNGGVFLGRTHHPGAFAALIVEGPFTWRVRPVAEGFYEREVDVGTIRTGLVGFIWKASDALSLDGAFRAGRAFDATLVEVRAGLTWSFEM
jgi:hypothetical protein